MRVRQHKGFGHELLPGTDHDMNCKSCQREHAAGQEPKIEGTDPHYCPLGLTEVQVYRILGDKRAAFEHWARGITVGICEGSEYHHNRGPCFDLEEDGLHTTDIPCDPHENYADHTRACGYLPGGEHVPTACAAQPHGIVFYRSDIEAFLAGRPNLD